MRRIFLASVLLLISGMAHAAGPAPDTIPTSDAKPSAAHPTTPEVTRIETDEKTGAVKVILNDLKTRMVKVYIDNHEVARFGPGIENCTPDNEGVVRYSNATPKIQFCDGKAWIAEEMPMQTNER